MENFIRPYLRLWISLLVFFLCAPQAALAQEAEAQVESQDTSFTAACSIHRGFSSHGSDEWETVPDFNTRAIDCYVPMNDQFILFSFGYELHIFARKIEYYHVDTVTSARAPFWKMEGAAYFQGDREPEILGGVKIIGKNIWYFQLFAGKQGREKHDIYIPKGRYRFGDNMYDTDLKIKSSVPAHAVLGIASGAFLSWNDFEFGVEGMFDFSIHRQYLQIEELQTSAEISELDRQKYLDHIQENGTSSKFYMSLSLGYRF